jgi:beta-lactamase regulating signal transducer with metallopeptidase domain
MTNLFENMPAVLGIIVEVALKGTLLMAAAATVTFAIRSGTATLRHMLWSFTLAAMLVIPALVVVLPRWQIGILPAPASQLPVAVVNPVIESSRELQPTLEGPTTEVPTSEIPLAEKEGTVTAVDTQRSWTDSLALLWLGGVAAGLIAIIGGLLTLRRVARQATSLDQPEWQRLVASLSAELGIGRRVRLLRSSHAAMPSTWGVVNHVVLLPSDATEWDDERRRVVLLHELAHVKRNDCLTQLVAQLCCAVYWFHPGVWFTARRVRAERELACDEHVLGAGINACDYAAHLLEVARICRAPAGTAIAIAMARPSQLEGRLKAILEERMAVRWRASRTTRRVIVASLALATLPLAAMRPWRSPATSSLSNSPSTSNSVVTAAADTFHWKGSVPRGKWVEVLTVYGDLRAEPSKTGDVEILAVRKRGDRGAYRIAFDTKSGVQFCVVKASANSDRPCRTAAGGKLVNGLEDVRVDFLLKVPAGVGVSAHTIRGNIAADDMKSYVWGTSGDGDISIVTTDLAEASTGIGSISAEFGRRSWRQDLEFYTDKGDVTVVAPSDASMMIQMETGSGGIRSEFPSRTSPFGGGQRSVASIGRGGGMLTLRTGRGKVELKRGEQAVGEVSDMSFEYSDAPITSVDPKPNPNPDPAYDPNPNPNPAYDPNPNEDPAYNPDPNINPHVEDDPTGERVPVTIPKGFLGRFSESAIREWKDAAAIRRLRNTASEHVKQHAVDLVSERSVWALTLVRNGEIIAPLRSALSNSDWRVRAYAAWALGSTREASATDALTAALGDEHWRVRMHAASGLQRLGTTRTVEPLIKALSDDYWQVRISSIDALAAIGDRRALPALEMIAQRDSRSFVRDEAQSAINRIK